LRGKFVSGTFAGRCNSASVRENGGFVDELVDLPVGGFDLALPANLAQIKIRSSVAKKCRVEDWRGIS